MADGCSVGAIEGPLELVGSSVGDSLGLPEISELGAIDGFNDGREDGAVDGVVDGEALDVLVGASDGETESEGKEVGISVGDEVGATQVFSNGRHRTRLLPAGANIPLH